MKTLLILLLVFSFSLRLSANQSDDPENLAKLLVEALRTEDYHALKNLILSKDDFIKMKDCDCAQGVWEHIKSYQNHFLRNFQKVHKQILELGLPISNLHYEGLKTNESEGFLNLHIHISINQYHGIIETAAVKTSIGYRLVSSYELLSNADEIKKVFGVENAKTFDKVNINLYYNDSSKLTHKQSSGKNELGDFEKITYYSNDSIYASITIILQKNLCNINHYFKNGNLRDSVIMRIRNDDSLKMILKPVKFWKDLPNVSVKQGDIVYNSIFYCNGKISFSREFLQNQTIIECDYRIDGQLSEDKKKYKDNIISLIEYDYFGNITENKHIYNKAKAETIEELKTFPNYNSIETRYNAGKYEMPLVNFVKKPEGWFVKLINPGTEYLFWSFKEQSYQQLPDNTFNTGMIKNQYKAYSDHKFEHPEYTLFYGYPDADKDAVRIALPVFNSIDSVSLGALMMAYRNQLLPLLCQENLVIDQGLKDKIKEYEQISAKLKTPISLNEIRNILEIRKGKAVADGIVEERTFDKMNELYSKLCLNEVENNNILFSSNALYLLNAQKQVGYRKDITIINPEYLAYKWYRDYIEGIFSVKPGTIFKLSLDFYDKSVLNKKIIERDIENSEILKKYLKVNETISNQLPVYVSFKNKNRKYAVDSLKLLYVDQLFVNNFGIGAIEIIDYMYNTMNINFYYSQNFMQSWLGCIHHGYFLQKLYFAPQDSCTDEFQVKANKFFSVPGYDEFNEQYLAYIFMSMAQDLTYLKPAKTNNLQNLYINITNLYNRRWGKDWYGLSIDLVIWGYESGYTDIADSFLKKCFIGQTDICFLVEYFDRDKIGKANSKLEEFLLKKGLKTIHDQYFKD